MGPVRRIYEYITRLSRYNLAMALRSDVEHRSQAPKSVGCFVLTVSDSRTDDTDTSGRAIAALLTAAGHTIAGHAIVKDDADLVRGAIERHLASPDVQAIITTGGTGITSRDSTYEAVSAMLHKRLDGFGELFRMLSYEQIGPAAMMSRACAGLVAGRIVVSLPGSEAAVRLAMEKLVIPELGHLVQQAGR
jgi:molybdenum cofactor biosynthesis protein B